VRGSCFIQRPATFSCMDRVRPGRPVTARGHRRKAPCVQRVWHRHLDPMLWLSASFHRCAAGLSKVQRDPMLSVRCQPYACPATPQAQRAEAIDPPPRSRVQSGFVFLPGGGLSSPKDRRILAPHARLETGPPERKKGPTACVRRRSGPARLPGRDTADQVGRMSGGRQGPRDRG